MSDKNYPGIIGKIYEGLKLTAWKNQTEFYMIIGMEDWEAYNYTNNGNSCSRTMHYDFFDLDKYPTIINRLKDNLSKNLEIDKKTTRGLNEKLIGILNQKNRYIRQIWKKKSDKEIENKLEEYEKEDIDTLIAYYRLYEGDMTDPVKSLYLILYLALSKNLPKELFYGTTYEKQLREFNENVTKLYGITSKPATRAILKLAECFIRKKNKIRKNLRKRAVCFIY